MSGSCSGKLQALKPILALPLAMLSGCMGASMPAQDSPPAQGRSPAQHQIPSHKGELLETASGLRYAILEPGKEGGQRPGFGDRVRVHVTVWLENGRLLESTRDKRAPIRQTVGAQMLPGLAEGLTLVPEGGRIKLVVPPNLAFGETGGPKVSPDSAPVPPGATLIYDVKLFELERGKKALPRFTRVPAEKEKPLDDELRYTVLKRGSGKKASATDILELRFALFNVNGQLLHCSEMPGHRNLRLKSGKGLAKALKFLAQALPLLEQGGRYRFHVPPALCYGAEGRGPLLPPNSDTIWELELVRTITPLPVPPFARSPLEKTTRTGSGLRYEVVRKGTGKSPGATSEVEVHYAGWLTNGKLFDSSYDQGETVTFPLDQVIPGWTEGLQLMKEGAVYKFTIPGDLAYGVRGNPRAGIGPNETLIFHIELIRVLK